MSPILSLVAVVLCTIGFLTDSTAFESKLFIALAEIKKVSIGALGNKEYLMPETILKYEKMRIQVMGLIDDIISEIQEEKSTNLIEELKSINEPLKELELYLERDKKDNSKIMNFSQGNINLVSEPITLSLEIINNIIEEVRDTRKETRDIKKDKIARLEKYNWDPIQK